VTPPIRAAATRLRIDSATAEVLRAFDSGGVQSILLKGASNRQWLEDSPVEARWYADCDLLVKPDDYDAAAQILGTLGFSADLDVARMPAWWRDHGVSWTRSADEAIIDLHRTLPGVGVDDDQAWTLLSAGTDKITVGGYAARAPALPARAMHLAIHAAQHGAAWSMGLGDLEHAIERAGDQTWLAAASFARQLDAAGAFVAGLRILPQGQALVERLGLVAAPRVDVALLGGNAAALTIEHFMRAGNLWVRLGMIRHKLFPPTTFVRHWSPLARRGRLGLVAAYAWRPVWVIRRAPRAALDWRRARRLSRTSGTDRCWPARRW
jgi:hypothetical protein